MSRPKRPWWLRYGSAPAVVAVATAFRAAVPTWIGQRQPFAFFILGVVAVAWFSGPGPSLLALLLGSFAGAMLLHAFGLPWNDPALAASVSFYLGVGSVLIAFITANRTALERLENEVEERRRAEVERESLRVQRRKLEADVEHRSVTLSRILEQAPVGIILLDTDLRCDTVNPYAASLAGLTPGEAQGRLLVDVLGERFGEGTASASLTRLRAVLETGTPDRVESMRLAPSRSPVEIVYADATTRRVEYAGGIVAGVLITVIDVTEKRLRDTAMRETDARLRSVVESDMIAVGFWEIGGRLTGANDTLLRMTGYSREDISEGRLSGNDLTPPEYRALDAEAAEELRRYGTCRPFEKEYLRKDGSRVPVLVGAATFPGTKDRGPFFALDVTERKRIEADLRQSERRFRQLAENVTDVFRVTEVADHRVLYVSPAYETVWGRPVAGLYEDSGEWLGAVHPDDRSRIEQAFFGGTTAGSFDETYRVVRPDNSVRWVRDRGFPVLNESGTVFRVAAIAEDVTERRRLEQELSARVAELAESHVRKDEFLAIMAHELRNPLASIRTALHVLRRDERGNGQDDRDGVLAIVERQVGHLTRLVNDLMDLARINRGRIGLQLAKTDLAGVVSRAADMSRPLIDLRRHELVLTLRDETLRVDGDPVRLEQVVVNLLNNAARYTDPGGRIEIEMSREDGDAFVRVRDNGIGIAPDMLPKIFDPFLQAERRLEQAEGGLGIGLSLVRSLAEMHGGTVSAFSRGLGLGSEFVLRLPAIPAEPPLPAPAPTPRANRRDSEPAPPRLRVLVVDDNEEAADSLVQLLTRLYKQDVRVAYDGPSALETAGEFRPDVVLLDIGMPQMDGHEVARRLRGRSDIGAPFLVAVTGWGQDEDRRRSQEAGFNLHLVKPVEPEVFRQLLANHSGVPGPGERSQ